MAKSHNQKAKILFLAQLMYETGENRTVTMQDILAKLAEYGIQAERKSIYDDFEALRDFGMDVRFKRGRPGGYYLIKNAETAVFEKVQAVQENTEHMDKTEKSEEVTGTVAAESVCHWTAPKEDAQNEKKPMKLLCSKEKEADIKAYFGENVELKERNPEYLTVTAPQISDEQFFGWLTAMGKEVHILKPKKLAAAYRDYLKALIKEYKGV